MLEYDRINFVEMNYRLILNNKGKYEYFYKSEQSYEFRAIVFLDIKKNESIGELPDEMKLFLLTHLSNPECKKEIYELSDSKSVKYGGNWIINRNKIIRLWGIYEMLDKSLYIRDTFKPTTRYWGKTIVDRIYLLENLFNIKYMYYELSWDIKDQKLGSKDTGDRQLSFFTNKAIHHLPLIVDED